MQESFLHFVWKYRYYNRPGLKLVSGQDVIILHPGQHNQLAGPDFLDARIRIEETMWAGHVEIHVNASDWYAHRHERDPAYENVILHVVWHNNFDVIGKAGVPIPTLQLRKQIPDDLYSSYEDLIRKRALFIPCEKEISDIDLIVIRSWLERLYLERLQRKVKAIEEVLDRTSGNWEAAFIIQLITGFGTKINKEAFAELAWQIPYRVLCKIRSNYQSLEALFMGMGRLLDIARTTDPYLMAQRMEYKYLRQKFDLKALNQERMHFFKLRPFNFPTIRLSQLAGLLHRSPDLFTQCIRSNSIGALYQILRMRTSPYWETHYTFGNTTSPRTKVTSRAFIESLLINVVIPFKYAYLRSRGKNPWMETMGLIEQIQPERNSIIDQFDELGISSASAMDTQALLELHTFYCRSKRCLECAIGHRLLGRK